MAWDDNNFCGFDVITGDKPFDEIGICFDKIVDSYEERFDRKPTVAEFLYSFNILMLSNGEEIFSDPENLNNMIIKISGGENEV